MGRFYCKMGISYYWVIIITKWGVVAKCFYILLLHSWSLFLLQNVTAYKNGSCGFFYIKWVFLGKMGNYYKMGCLQNG